VETRTKSLTAEQVRALTLPAAQAWLRRLITDAPVEVAVVGDVEREAATRLVTRYLGALPARPRVGDKTLASLRTIARPPGAISIAESVVVLTPQAAVMSGFFGADLRDVRDTRLLNMAARILSTRMAKTIREAKQLVYSIGPRRIPPPSIRDSASSRRPLPRSPPRRRSWRRRWRRCTASSPRTGRRPRS